MRTLGGERPIQFFLWLAAFLLAWISFIQFTGFWPVLGTYWKITVAMAAGSFVAGSTPVAGGTIGFPVLVYLFGYPAALGRTFCLMIQSCGMVSASIFILSRRTRVEWRVLVYSLLGTLAATPISILWIAPHLSDGYAKLLFAVVYASFGLLHIARMNEILSNHGPSRVRFTIDRSIAFGIGVLGGILASMIGVGADILLYGVLVLIYHTDIKIAIPTSVIQMAATSLIGTATLLLSANLKPSLQAEVDQMFGYWLAAAPIVVCCGPLGSFISQRIPRRFHLGFVALLCLCQSAWMAAQMKLTSSNLGLFLAAVVAVNFALHQLFLFGQQTLRRRQAGEL